MEPLPPDLAALVASLPPNAPAPATGAVLTAVIRAILLENLKYQVDLAGLLLELEIPAPLKPGDRVPVKVVEASRDRLVLQVMPRSEDAPARPPAPRPTSADIVRQTGLEPTSANVRAVEVLTRFGGAIDREAVETVARAPSGPVERAAALMVSRGLIPAPRDVETVARAIASPPPSAPPMAPVLQEIARVIEKASIDPSKPPPAEPLPRPDVAARPVIENVLRQNPQLAVIDAAVRELETLLSTLPGPATPIPPTEWIDKIMAARTADDVVKLLAAMPRERALVLAVLKALGEIELREIASLEPVRRMREALKAPARPAALDLVDRAVGLRILSNLSALHGENLTIFELPIHPGAKHDLERALVILKRGRRPNREHGGYESLTLDVVMSRLGRVVASAALTPHHLAVRFQVRDKPEKRLFEKHAGELAGALKALGFDATVTVADRGGAEGPPLPEALFELGGPALDVTA